MKTCKLTFTMLCQEKQREYETRLPFLAQDVLVIPASSTPSERTFSISGILSAGRMGLISPANLEKRVVVKCNPYL